RYNVKLYALALQGSHMHELARFPELQRSNFMRDLNSQVAKAVDRLAPGYPGGKFWQRRYSQEFVPGDDDIENQFFYIALQPVNDGLVEKISDYPGYNFFHDAVTGRVRKFKVVRWAEFNSARRYNKHIRVEQFTEIVELRFERLPGYEHLSQKEYAKEMYAKLESRRQAIIAARRAEGKGFLGRDALLKTRPGSRPKNPKVSSWGDHRPRVLSVCPIRRKEYLDWYFDMYFRYKEASKRYRAGERNVEFPPGMYPPHLPMI